MILITKGLIAELVLLAYTNKDVFHQRINDIFEQYPYIEKQYSEFMRIHGQSHKYQEGRTK